MYKTRVNIFLVFALIPLFLCAQQRNGLYADVLSFTVEKGLPSRSINETLLDHRGMIWLATDNGLCVFNGLDVQIYNQYPASALKLPSTQVNDIAEDQLGRLWICSGRGLKVMSTDRSRFMSMQELGFSDSIFTKGHCLIEPHPKGGLWLLTSTSLFWIKFEPQRLRLISLGPNPFPAYEKKLFLASKKGELWATARSEVAIWQNGKFTIYKYPYFLNQPNTPRSYLSDSYAELSCLAGDSIVLIGNFDNGKHQIFKINHEKRTWQPISNTDPAKSKLLAFLQLKQQLRAQTADSNDILLKDMIQDYQGNQWFVTNTGLYGVKDAKNEIFSHLAETFNHSIRKIFQDEQGRIWVHSYSGLNVFSPEMTPLFSSKKMVTAWDMLQIDASHYLMCYESTTGLGLFQLQGKKLTQVHSFPFHQVFDMARIGDTVWLVNNHAEILGFNLQNHQVVQKIQVPDYSTDLSAGVLKSIVIDRHKNLWIAGTGGLFYFQRTLEGLYQKSKLELPEQLRTTSIHALYLDQNDALWIGTASEGLIHYVPASGQFRQYQIMDGLPNQIIYSIQGASDDQLIWLGTQKGLSCFKVSTQQFFNFFESNGLPGNEFNTSAQLLAKNGLLYMGGTRGVAYLNPEELSLHRQKIKPYVELSLNKLKTKQSTTFYPLAHSLVYVSQSITFAEIRFFSNDILGAESAYFKYKIGTEEQHWRYAKPGEKILLNLLKAGKFDLLVSIQNNGTWTEAYRVTLKIATNWYQSWWFYSSLSLLFILGLYLLYRLRITQLKKEYLLRKQIAEDLHDDLGTRIYALKSLSFQITRAEMRQQEYRELLSNFDNLSKETLLVIRNFIWAFDPKNDQLNDLIQKMEGFVHSTIKPISEEIKIVTYPTLSSLKMKPRVKYHGLRAFQELLTNMVKHTHSRQIAIDFETNEHFLLITVQNSYTHLKASDSTIEHYGQGSLKRRIREAGGQLEWNDADHCQTVRLKLPLI